MRFQPRRFVVEVKRGTNREAFISHGDGPDRFAGAEALMFGEPKPPVAADREFAGAPAKPTGRILPALDVPDPIVTAEPQATARRGRPPGSKNKPKLAAASSRPLSSSTIGIGTPGPVIDEVAAETDIGGRLYGSGPSARGTVGTPDSLDGTPNGARGLRARLRHRSRILRRYVLGTEPRPGQRGSLRARKAERFLSNVGPRPHR
jgi:hypothetical protein